ncbi:MurR/RpiR family transcriptional regulator [Collinsella sp. An2]|uniref:MurR/RpiR family transcriptional regulator n=1 Tax=Collinsella sp. An2 TaxID=1965585 RepID=UPI000B37CCB7|nr:MurR/RpiR family transcriptional regulator [Collinsella sp. An2]OUP11070.1 hypothetical protein B5F33_01455 [Collinsella sp. An2]
MFTVDEIKSLNELELCVYRYVATHQEDACYMKIRDLAEAAHVSTTTVLHFCKKMGCDGFAEFRLRFRDYRRYLSGHRQRYDASEITHFFQRVGDSSYQAEIDQVASVLKAAPCIIFVGVGNSAFTAQYAARYFSNAGAFSLSVTDPFHPAEISQDLPVTIVVISVSGETTETLDIANKFKFRGCPIVSITMSENCTLARLADYHLSCYLTQVKKGTLDLTTQVPILYLVEQLGYRMLEDGAPASE